MGMQQKFYLLIGTLILLVLAGCSGAATQPESTPTASDRQNVLDALRAIGLELTLVDTFDGIAFVPQQTAAYRVGGKAVEEAKLGEGSLSLAVFASTSDAERVAAAVPANADNGMTDWAGIPHYFRCDNLIVVYLDYQTFNRDEDQTLLAALTNRCGPQFAGQTAWVNDSIVGPTTIPTWTPAAER